MTEAMRLLCQPQKSCGAGCEFSAGYYKAKNRWFTSPKVGDQIFFKNKSSSFAHTGIVVAVDGEKVYTVEGNTSGTLGVVANGGGVCKKSYSLTYSNIVGYGRPAYTDESALPSSKGGSVTVNVSVLKRGSIGSQVKALQALLNGYGFNCGSVDGDFGSKTHVALCRYQEAVGLEIDGSCGPKTWRSLLGV